MIILILSCPCSKNHPRKTIHGHTNTHTHMKPNKNVNKHATDYKHCIFIDVNSTRKYCGFVSFSFFSLFSSSSNNWVFCTINTMIAFEQQCCCSCLCAIGFSDGFLPSYHTIFTKCIQCERELKGIHENFVCLSVCECINRNTFGFINQYLSVEWNSDLFFFHENIGINKLLPKLKVCDGNNSRFVGYKKKFIGIAMRWSYVYTRIRIQSQLHPFMILIHFSVSKLVCKIFCNYFTCNHFALVIRHGLHAPASRNANNTNRIKFLLKCKAHIISLSLIYNVLIGK